MVPFSTVYDVPVKTPVVPVILPLVSVTAPTVSELLPISNVPPEIVTGVESEIRFDVERFKVPAEMVRRFVAPAASWSVHPPEALLKMRL